MSESEIVKDFLVESYENLDRLDRDLVGLEKNPEASKPWPGFFAPFIPSREPAAFWDSINWRKSPTRVKTCSPGCETAN